MFQINNSVSTPFILKTILILCFSFAGLIYWQGLHGPFLLDDLQTLDSARISSWSFREILATSFANQTGPLSRPLSVFSFIVTDQLFGNAPFGYKITNLGLHILCATLCFIFMKHWLCLFFPTNNHKPWILASLISILWILHPLNVSTTLYVVQRMAILSTLFTLLNLILYLKIRFGDLKPLPKKLSLACMLLLFVCATLSKENGLLLPFFLAAIELTTPTSKSSKIWLKLTLGSCIIILLGGGLYYAHHFASFQAAFYQKGFSLLSYTLVEAKALIFYIKLIALPQINAMGLYHDDFQATLSPNLWLSLFILLGLFITILFTRKKAPILSFGLMWFFSGHLLESSILPLEPVFEHRNYLASIGLLLILVWLFTLAFEKMKLKPFYMPIIAFIWIGLFSLLTALRVDGWSTQEKFIKMAIQTHPASPRAHIEYGQYLFQAGYFDEGILSLQKAAELDHRNSGPVLHQILAHCTIGRAQPSLYTEATQRLATQNITPYTLLVLDGIVNQQFNDNCPSISSIESTQWLQTAISNPFTSPKNKGILFHLLAGIYAKDSQYELAISALEKSSEYFPNKIEPHLKKIQLLILLNKQHEAQTHIKATYLHPLSARTDNQKKLSELQNQLNLDEL